MTKSGRKKRRCQWCREFFKPKTGGRPALFCSPSCRQRAYEKRKWTPYSALDALRLDLLPPAAMRRLEQEIRHAHMVELLKSGIVPLTDPAQIDGVLDGVKEPARRQLLNLIELACRRREDEQAMATLAHWRMQRQNPL